MLDTTRDASRILVHYPSPKVDPVVDIDEEWLQSPPLSEGCQRSCTTTTTTTGVVFPTSTVVEIDTSGCCPPLSNYVRY